MIELKNMDAGYGKQVRVQGVNVKFRQGELTAVVGPNGSGKSTIMKSIVGLCQVFTGTVWIQGEPAADMGNKKIATLVSYLPQNRNLPAITAQKMVLHGRFPYLSYPRHYSDEDRQQVKLAMEKLGIWEQRHQYMANLSGGERQKVYLAMALAGDTKGFLLDEPTTWLDICYQIEFMNLLRDLRDEGRTIAVILHDLNAALQYADRIVVMDKGHAVAVDTPENIYQSRILEQVFHIESRCFQDENGKLYYYFH